MNRCPSLKSFAISNRLSSMIAVYLAPSIFLSTLSSLPIFLKEKHPRSMMLPPPSSTVKTVCSGWWAVQVFHPHTVLHLVQKVTFWPNLSKSTFPIFLMSHLNWEHANSWDCAKSPSEDKPMDAQRVFVLTSAVCDSEKANVPHGASVSVFCERQRDVKGAVRLRGSCCGCWAFDSRRCEGWHLHGRAMGETEGRISEGKREAEKRGRRVLFYTCWFERSQQKRIKHTYCEQENCTFRLLGKLQWASFLSHSPYSGVSLLHAIDISVSVV